MKYWLATLICLIVLKTKAQHIDTLQNKLNEFYQQIPSEKLFVEVNYHDLPVELFKKEFYEQKSFGDSLLLNKISLNQQDIGLHFRSNAKYNLLKSALPNSEDFLRSRVNVSAGLEWDVLKYGWKDRKIKEQLLLTELEIEQLNQKLHKDQENYLYRYHHINYVFNQFLLDELRFHFQLYKEQIAIYTEMYYLNLIPYTEIITLKQHQKEIETQISEIENYNNALNFTSSYQHNEFPVFDLNLNEIVKTFQEFTIADTILQKQKRHLQTSYLLKDEMTLGVYTHLQVFKPATDNEWVVSPVIGVNMSVPLFQNKKQQAQSLNFEQKILTENHKVKKEEDLKLIYQLYSIYQTHLKDINSLHYRLFLEKEKLHSALILKKKADQNSIISTFVHLNNLLEVRREVTLVQQQMYLVALQIFTATNTSSLEAYSPMIKFIEWENIRPKATAIILDANKDLTDIQFFIQYLKRKGINKIYLAGLGDTYNLTKQLLELEGFEMLTEVRKSSILRIQDFNSLRDLKSTLHQTEELVVLQDVHELIAFEKSTFKP